MLDTVAPASEKTSPVALVARTFALQRQPTNVRLSTWLDQMRITRFVRRSHEKIRKLALKVPLLSHDGRFAYRRGRDVHEVVFNGYNLQFHALYDPLYRHGYELETCSLLIHLCGGSGAFFDIGSNWGYFSLLLAAAPEFSGPIFAFEPNPRSFADLRDVIGQAGVSDRVHACNFGLGREPAEFTVSETDAHSTGVARLTKEGSGPRISVKRLDDLDLPVPNLIKIDAEGMEADILGGSARLLGVARPFVVFESLIGDSSPEDIHAPFEVLRAHDYRFFLPSLVFANGNRPVLTTYNCNLDALLARDPSPKLGLLEFNACRRTLFRTQVNVLAAPVERIAAMWAAGMVNLNDDLDSGTGPGRDASLEPARKIPNSASL